MHELSSGNEPKKTYNGYANKDTYDFDIVWANNQGLYAAFREYAERHPWQTPQTLGRNIKDAVSAALNNGGWGWGGIPDWLQHLPWQTWRDIDATVSDMRKVSETELGEAVKKTLGL